MSLKRKATELAAEEAQKPKANKSLHSFFSTTAPANSSKTSSANSASLPTVPPPEFDKEAWVAKLTPEQRELLKLEIDTLHESWLPYLQDELVSKEFISLKKFLAQEVAAGKKVFPPSQDVYSWSRHTPLPTVKCVILGQDPYHNVNQAHGLCFSVRPPTPAPPSLKNIFTCLSNDFPDSFKPPPGKSGLLTPWADRGVLLLNASLTVRAHEANSHQNKGWEKFTQKVVDTVARVRSRGVVFLAWGASAQAKVKSVSAGKHLVLKTVHPSPLSASKGFMTCGHFKQANTWLKERYGEEDGPINWDLNVKPEDAGV
ncbi:MAG: uracil DNA glycosylase [Bathelium mastoideum]|nr:MAG: uracil DNA glycosylase [Bathelium mastoideum]KAI9684008.1 MAG: uracil DNA glycosylase [Bathelium mastoideum]